VHGAKVATALLFVTLVVALSRHLIVARKVRLAPPPRARFRSRCLRDRLALLRLI